jgi:hypothetical protein
VSLAVVFDTNILFSAVGWSGNPYRCLELARTGVVKGIRRHLLPIGHYEGIGIVTASEFLTISPAED